MKRGDKSDLFIDNAVDRESLFFFLSHLILSKEYIMASKIT